VIAVGKSASWTWLGATIVAVTMTLCAACVQAPSPPPHPIQDKIDRDARFDGNWTGT
jgi:hypothetical protein